MEHKKNEMIQICNMDHIDRYGKIYAAAFSGEPWNDHWKTEDAVIPVRILRTRFSSKQQQGHIRN